MIDVLWFILMLPWTLFKWSVVVCGWGVLGIFIYEQIQDAITYRRFK
tara:strand:- start:2191 stop:2331 length:141 start_codon:yes stop_codon:yes gene_type:complete